MKKILVGVAMIMVVVGTFFLGHAVGTKDGIKTAVTSEGWVMEIDGENVFALTVEDNFYWWYID